MAQQAKLNNAIKSGVIFWPKAKVEDNLEDTLDDSLARIPIPSPAACTPQGQPLQASRLLP